MSFKKQLYQNFIWRIFYFVSIFILNIAIARSYEATQSGWVNFISTNFALAITFGSLSLEVAVLYFGSKAAISTPKLSTFSIIWAAVTSLIFYFIVAYITTTADSIASKGLLHFGATSYFAGILFTNFFMNLFLVHKQYMLPNAILGILNLLLIFLVPDLSFSIPIFDKQTFLYLFYFWYLLQAAALIIAYYIYSGKLVFALPSKQELQQLFRYAFAAILGNVTFFLLTKIDFWLVDFYKSSEELGNYTNAAKLGQTLLLFAMITATSIFIHTASQQASKKQVLQLMQMSRLFLLFFTVVFLVFLCIGKPLFYFVFGKSYTLLPATFLAMLPGIFALSVVVLFGNFFGAINKSIFNVWNNIAGIACIVVLDYFILPKSSIIGAALVSAFGYTVTMLLSFYKMRQLFSFTKNDLLVFKKSDFNFITKFVKLKQL